MVVPAVVTVAAVTAADCDQQPSTAPGNIKHREKAA
jgi:hypothetical protein